MTDTPAARFLAQSPTLLTTIGEFRFYEHPTRGDTAPVYMITPDGRLIDTGFYDMGDFDLTLCEELAANRPYSEEDANRIKLNGRIGGWQ
jgi:hypothetical protein